MTNNTPAAAPSGLSQKDLAPAIESSVTPLTDSDWSRVVHIRGTEESGERRILLAYDTTADGEIAYEHTLSKLTQKGDHVFLATILPAVLLDSSLLAFAPEYSIGQDIQLLRAMNANAMKHLREKAEALIAKGVDVTLHVAHGDPRYSLLALASHHKVDMIVLGRRKLGRFQKLISPASVSSYVLSHADCTVVVVKA